MYLMRERSIDMLALYESRLAGKYTKILHDNYQLIYRRGRASHHEVGVIITEEVKERMDEVKQSSMRVMFFWLG